MSSAYMILCALVLFCAVASGACHLLDVAFGWSMRKHGESVRDFELVRKALR